MTGDEYFNDHIPHRVNLLTTFRERYGPKPSRPGYRDGEPPDFFRCSKDISMLMVRFFCTEMGLHLPKRGMGKKQGVELEESHKLPHSFNIQRFTVLEAKSDSRYQSLLAVMKAANRAVAHIEDLDVNHPIQTEAEHYMLIDSIDWVEELIQSHMYGPNRRLLKHAMTLPQNVMDRR